MCSSKRGINDGFGHLPIRTHHPHQGCNDPLGRAGYHRTPSEQAGYVPGKGSYSQDHYISHQYSDGAKTKKKIRRNAGPDKQNNQNYNRLMRNQDRWYYGRLCVIILATTIMLFIVIIGLFYIATPLTRNLTKNLIKWGLTKSSSHRF